MVEASESVLAHGDCGVVRERFGCGGGADRVPGEADADRW